MKTIKYILATLILITQASCVDKKFEEEFKITVTPDAVVNKTEISVVNAKASSNGEYVPLQNARINFSKSDAEKIYTVGGKKSDSNNGFEINEGHIVLGVLANLNYTEDNPLTIDATIKSDDFLNLPVQLTFAGQNFSSVQFTLNKKDDLPNGVTYEEMLIGSSKLNANGETTEVITSTISTSTRDNEGNLIEEEIEMTIPENTGFLDENGNQVATSEVELQVQTFSPSSTEADGFPGGLGIDELETLPNVGVPQVNTPYLQKTNTVKNLISSNGDVIIPVTNLYCMYGYARSVYLANCTRKTVVKSYFYQRGKNIINPITNQLVKVGDELDIYFKRRKYSSATTFLTKAAVKFDSFRNKFYCEFETDRFGIYPMGFTLTNDNSCNISNFSSLTFTNNGSPGWYRYRIYHENLPGRNIAYGWFYMGSSKTLNSRNLRTNYYLRRLTSLSRPGLKLKIDAWSYNSYTYQNVYDQKTTLCELSGKTIAIDHPDCREQINLDLNINCPDVNIALNYAAIYYKPETSNYYRYYGSVYRGFVNAYAPCLEPNQNYKFRVWYNGFKESPTVQGKDVYQAIDLLKTDNFCDELPEF